MPVIEAQCASILVPHDHRHLNQKRTFAQNATMYEHTGRLAVRQAIAITAMRPLFRSVGIWVFGE
jgi:hypothetical protein